MKAISLLSLCLALALSSSSQSLNQFGHIIGLEEKLDFVHEAYRTRAVTPFGTIQIESYYENAPSFISLFGGDKELFRKEFRQCINLQVSDNQRFLAFFDFRQIHVLDLKSFNLKSYDDASPIFSLNDQGDLAYASNDQMTLRFKDQIENFDKVIRDIEIVNDDIYLFSRNFLAVLSTQTEMKVKDIRLLHGSFFEAKVKGDSVIYVEKKRFNDRYEFTLTQRRRGRKKELDRVTYYKKAHQTLNLRSDQISSPLKYGQQNVAHPIGNSYAEIQDYGGQAYLHPGVDFLGDPNEEVYAVKAGEAKSVITTSAAHHWRIAISNEMNDAFNSGYLYAHLIENTILFAPGDTVEEGDVLGLLIDWGFADFTHVHFSNIEDSGQVWSGDWHTIDNSLADVVNLIDTSKPVFENAVGDELFGFQDAFGQFLKPDSLFGEVTIIDHSYDQINSHWHVETDAINYRIFEADDLSVPVFEIIDAIDFDIPTDVYHNNSQTYIDLNHMYSRQSPCYSDGNYSYREFYHYLNNEMFGGSENAIFNTHLFQDGDYVLEVEASDVSGNHNSAQMPFSIKNNSSTLLLEEEKAKFELRENTLIVNSINPVKIDLYDLKGRSIMSAKSNGTFSFLLSELTSGLYILSIQGAKDQKRAKIMVN